MGPETPRPRIGVTRAAGQGDDLARRVAEAGGEPVVWPLIAVEPLGGAPIDPAGYDWVVVTSPNGAAELARRLAAPPARLAAIGPGTAAALRARGYEPDLVPSVSTQEGLLAELPRPVGRVLFAVAEGARRLLAAELDADFLPLYRTLELAPEATPELDLVLLASPSAARALARTPARDVPVVAIGPQTAAAARDLGLDIAAEADTHDLDGLVASLRRVLGRFIERGGHGLIELRAIQIGLLTRRVHGQRGRLQSLIGIVKLQRQVPDRPQPVFEIESMRDFLLHPRATHNKFHAHKACGNPCSAHAQRQPTAHRKHASLEWLTLLAALAAFKPVKLLLPDASGR